jgi:hypothetical protein
LLGATLVAAATTIVFALQGNSTRETAPSANDRTSARLTVGPGSLHLTGSFQ